MELGKKAVAYWHVVRSRRAVFETDWSPRLGVFRPGAKRAHVHVSVEKCPLLLLDVRTMCVRGEASLARLRHAVVCRAPAFRGGPRFDINGSWDPSLGGFVVRGVLRSEAIAGGCGASRIRRVYKRACCFRRGEGSVPENEQSGVGQLAHMVS